MPRAALLAVLAGSALAFLPPQNPPWEAAWGMNKSTISMFCNASGPFDPALTSHLGIASFDWSNMKKIWAAAKPMTTQELLLEQARLTKAQGGAGRIFTYFNLVKALPWFAVVREKLVDPAYSGFFLRFDPSVVPHVPACDPVTGDCTPFYHDQLQTPQVPSPANPNPDGACAGYCDVGAGVPAGEFLWDHRNTTVRDFLVEVITGPAFLGADGGNLVSGLFIDDFWCSDIVNGTGACTDPVQGPTEIDAHSQRDMGLSDEDVRDITVGWLDTMTRAQAAIVAAGGYTWSLIPGQDNANAQPLMLAPGASACGAIRAACAPGALWQRAPLLLGLTPGNASRWLPRLEEEIAAFLLMRGPHAYLGWGQWGMSWVRCRSQPLPLALRRGCRLTAPHTTPTFLFSPLALLGTRQTRRCRFRRSSRRATGARPARSASRWRPRSLRASSPRARCSSIAKRTHMSCLLRFETEVKGEGR